MREFILHLVDEPPRSRAGEEPAPTPVRMRRLLKAMLRQYGFRVLWNLEVPLEHERGAMPALSADQLSADGS